MDKLSKKAMSLLKLIGKAEKSGMKKLGRRHAKAAKELQSNGLVQQLIYISTGGAYICLNKAGIALYEKMDFEENVPGDPALLTQPGLGIHGKLDWVKIEGGKINCRNFDEPYDLREEILEILQWYGEAVDPHGWEISKRQVAADILLAIINKNLEIIKR